MVHSVAQGWQIDCFKVRLTFTIKEILELYCYISMYEGKYPVGQ